MSKYANAGELITAVVFKKPVVVGKDSYGIAVIDEQSVFGGEAVMCKWVNAHGTEALTAASMKLRDPATLTTRYSPPLEDVTLILYRAGDPKPYSVISVDNIEQRNEWLEIKVQRYKKA
jgi:hypothetical protein